MAEIAKLSVKLGYVTAIDFFNTQSVAPTPGVHSAFVTHLFDSISAADFWFFAVELYSDPDTYWGVLIAFDNRVLLVNSALEPVYANVIPAEAGALLAIDETGDGLQEFYSNEIPLDDITPADTVRYLQIYNATAYGNENWFVRVKDSTVTYLNGIINARTTLDSVLGAYNIKVDKLPFALIEMVSAKDQRVQFQISITPTFVQEYIYTRMGQKLYVQDTPTARKRVRELVRQQIVFANV